MPDRLVEEFRAELQARAPDVWLRVLRTITARRIAAELFATLERPPAPQSRLGWELRQRVHRSLSLREVS